MFHCERCHKEFGFGEWWCSTGEPHVVKPKEYFLLDTSGGRTLITNIPPGNLPPDWRPGQDDQFLGGVAEFIDGRFTTTDPEQQYWLDRREGLCCKEEWEHARPMTREQRIEMEEQRLKEAEQEMAQLRKEAAYAKA